MACGWVAVRLKGPETVVVACVLANVLQVVPDGVGGAGGVGTDLINNNKDNQINYNNKLWKKKKLKII